MLAELHLPPTETLEPRVARELYTPADAAMAVLGSSAIKRGLTPVPVPVGRVDHAVMDGPGGPVLLRVYTPKGDPDDERGWPVLVYYHGGGFVIANLNVYDTSARLLCDAADCVVVSVAYRQAPEHPYPAAMNDAYAAYLWTVKNAREMGGDASRVAVGGESAGGNLAAVVSMRARDEGAPLPVHQLLIYPVVDSHMATPSYRDEANAEPLSAGKMAWFFKHYAAPPGPYATPLQAESLEGLPPATVLAAEHDPLRSEGRAYADRLRGAGVPTDYTLYPGTVHEFFGMAAVVDQAKAAVAAAGKALRAAFKT